MWLSLFGVVLILCIAFFQALQGLFSGVIMCVLTILSAALAFGTFEDLYYGVLIDRMPNHGEAVALVSIFILSLLLLRTLADNGIKGNMVFPVWADRIGGFLLGFVSATIIVGFIELGFQSLPFDSTFLGFNRFVAVNKATGKALDEKQAKTANADGIEWRRESLMFSPDEFTVKLVAALSDNALGGRTRFREVHPDYTAGIQDSRNAVQRESNRVALSTSAIDAPVKGYWLLPPGEMVRLKRETDQANNDRLLEEPSPIPPAGQERRVYRVALANEAMDPDNNFRFRGSQVRIVGTDGPGGKPVQYTLKGLLREPKAATPSPSGGPEVKTSGKPYVEVFREPLLGKAEWSDIIRPATTKYFEFVFDVPKTFQASFIEFKRTAKLDVSAWRKPLDKPPTGAVAGKGRPTKQGGEPAPGESPPADPGRTPPPSQSPNRIAGVWLGDAKPAYRDRLPLRIVEKSLQDADVTGGKLYGGHVILAVKAEHRTDDDAERLAVDVPGDMRLLFVPVKELDPQSYLGQARGFAQRALPTVGLKLDDGQKIKPVGKYAFAKIDGQWWFECYYLDVDARDAQRDVPIFDRIKHANLTEPDSVYVYMFLVPVGKTAVELTREKAEGINLQSYNLVAQ